MLQHSEHAIRHRVVSWVLVVQGEIVVQLDHGLSCDCDKYAPAPKTPQWASKSRSPPQTTSKRHYNGIVSGFGRMWPSSTPSVYLIGAESARRRRSDRKRMIPIRRRATTANMSPATSPAT